MQFATGDQIQGNVASGQTINPSIEQLAPHENDNDTLPESSSLCREQDLQIVARATNDAVRDWDVKTGRLIWPQGVESLLGYCRSSVPEEIAFWQQQLHPE